MDAAALTLRASARAEETVGASDEWTVHAVPTRLAGGAISGLNVFYAAVTPWEAWQERLGRVLADLAVLGLSQDDDPARAHRPSRPWRRSPTG